MNERIWLDRGDPEQKLGYLAGSASDRKLRLFACACYRTLWDKLDERSRLVVQQMDSPSESDDSAPEVPLPRTPAALAVHALHDCPPRAAAVQAAQAAARGGLTVEAILRNLAVVHTTTAHVCRMDRCVFGNPFRPIRIDPAWQTSAVLSLAQAAFDNRILPEGSLDAARLAVLADALEEAGCTNSDILDHLRIAGPHVRGCWVLDLLTGRE